MPGGNQADVPEFACLIPAVSPVETQAQVSCGGRVGLLLVDGSLALLWLTIFASVGGSTVRCHPCVHVTLIPAEVRLHTAACRNARS